MCGTNSPAKTRGSQTLAPRGFRWGVLAPAVMACLLGAGWTRAEESEGRTEQSQPTLAGARTEPSMRERAAELDRIMAGHMESQGISAGGLARDEVFLRRVYLDLAGRIPKLSEVRAFLDSKHPDKRERLVDELLDSPAFVSHQFNFWADLLRAKSRLQDGNPGQPYVEFVKQSLRDNLPYDQFVKKMITASGPVLAPANGATGYFLRDFNMPEDNMANSVRVFLGTRLECAQCHDHPFDRWKQREFFEMVAFTGGMRMRIPPTEAIDGMTLRRRLKEANVEPEVRQAALRILRPLSYGIDGGGTGLARLPDTYQYDDGRPQEIVTAQTIFGPATPLAPDIPHGRRGDRPRRAGPKKQSTSTDVPGAHDIGSREAFAEWLTSPENPRFTLVIANRMWKKMFGHGLVEPVDDMTDDTIASNPPLLEYLTRSMVELRYDLRQFQRLLCYSQAYQREALTSQDNEAVPLALPAPLMRRLSAEQLWDSFVTLAVADVDTKQRPQSAAGRARMPLNGLSYETLGDLDVDQILEMARQQVDMRDNPQRRQEMRRQWMQSMGDGRIDHRKLSELRPAIAAARKELRAAQEKKDAPSIRQAQMRLRELVQSARGKAGAAPDLVRASELPSPAPEGHFLREFGQSDREQIDNAHREPAVTQVLSLMNGTIETRIIQNPNTVLMRDIEQARSPGDKVDVVFLSLLCRYPSSEEKKLWIKEGQRYGPSAAVDLIWTLANSNEFMFQK